jgi:hypothetical protein
MISCVFRHPLLCFGLAIKKSKSGEHAFPCFGWDFEQRFFINPGPQGKGCVSSLIGILPHIFSNQSLQSVGEAEIKRF